MCFRNFLFYLNHSLVIAILVSLCQLAHAENQCTCLINLSGTKDSAKTLIDLSDKLPTQDNLDTINGLTACELNCRLATKAYLNYGNNLENMDIVNYNINTNKESANKLCKLVNGEEIINPGSNVNIKIKRKSDDSFIKDIYLGKLCCNLPCSCQIRSSSGVATSSLFMDFSDQLLKERVPNESFKCNDEMIACETKCRKMQ